MEVLREEVKLDHSLSEEELQVSKNQQSQALMLLQQQQQMNQVLLSLIEKIVAEKLEQFIYQFILVRCLLIYILKGCNTVLLFKRSLFVLKCLHMSCLVALTPMGNV